MGMKMIIFALLSIALASCSLQDETHVFIEKEALPYYNEFIAEANSRGINTSINDITISYKDLSDKSYCGLTVYEKGTIYLDTASSCWKTDRRELIFHELGHLLLHREHDATIINGSPKTIMYPGGYISEFKSNQKYYIDELFNPNTKFNVIQVDTVIHPVLPNVVFKPI